MLEFLWSLVYTITTTFEAQCMVWHRNERDEVAWVGSRQIGVQIICVTRSAAESYQ